MKNKKYDNIYNVFVLFIKPVIVEEIALRCVSNKRPFLFDALLIKRTLFQ